MSRPSLGALSLFAKMCSALYRLCYIRVVAPRPPDYGTGGAFHYGGFEMVTARVFVDYQNLHMTAYEQFAAYSDKKPDYRVHPGRFANVVGASLANVLKDTVTVTRLDMYRGVPNPRREPRMSSLINREHAAWNVDPRVTINTRPLRYPRDWPDEKAQEKGVDVMLALGIVRAALDDETDYIIVATRDTDMLPALEMADDEKPGCLAIASWDGSSVLRLPGRQVHELSLGRSQFQQCRDTTRY